MKKKTKSKKKREVKATEPQVDEYDETTNEARVSAVQSDPIFYEMPRREKKIKVDSRFKAMFDDPRFASTSASVDRHGRPVNKLKSREDLHNLYELDQSSDDDEKQKEPTFVAEKLKKKKVDFARGEGNVSSSSDEDNSDAESTNEDDTNGVHDRWGELDRDARKVEWTSRRLALCNIDWDKMTAEDIFVALESFKPEGGVIKSVRVYLSDFGAEQLEYEEKHGPKLAKTDQEHKKSDYDGEVKPELIRAYQFDRFRFYYAVIECDSAETANVLYEKCDGIQYQSSGLTLDLRFIPDDMDFDSNRLRDQCLPDSVNLRKYKPNHFQSGITRSTAKLDWDDNEFHRQVKVQKAFNEDADLEELGGLIASGSDEDGEGNDEGANFLLSVASIDPKKNTVYTSKHGTTDEEPVEKQPAKKKPKLKQKLLEKKKRKLADMATNLPANLDDSRFSALYESSDFAIDKTNPNYKGGALADCQIREKIRRKN